jgi:hypothetical protein
MVSYVGKSGRLDALVFGREKVLAGSLLNSDLLKK